MGRSIYCGEQHGLRPGNDRCDIRYPADLGRNPITGQRAGFKHPVIVWANGSGQPSSKYAYYLQHLASWDFVVIAPRDKATGTGDTTLDAADHILKRGSSRGDAFFNRIDSNNVGVSGHSQGGSSILKLASEGSGPFSTFVPIHAVPGFFSRICCKFDMQALTDTPANAAILYLSGTGDKGNDRENRSAYDITAPRSTKAIGLFNGPRHDDILGTPGCVPSMPWTYGADVNTGLRHRVVHVALARRPRRPNPIPAVWEVYDSQLLMELHGVQCPKA